MTGTSYASAGPDCNPEHGACAINTDSGPFAVSEPADPIDCLGPAAGTRTATPRSREHITFFNSDKPFFDFRETYTEVGRMDFPSGVYVLYDLTERFTYISGTVRTTTVTTTVVHNDGTVYAADGRPTGQRVKIHAVAHFTWIDLNHNGDPDPDDVYRATVDQFRATCR